MRAGERQIERDVQAERRQVQPRGRTVTSTPAVVIPPPPTGRASADPEPSVAATSAELNELRDQYDELANRAGAVDDNLNRLWEEMRPLAPRLDIATRQRSLQTALGRTREALAEKNAADARRYMDNARADLGALEQFLGR